LAFLLHLLHPGITPTVSAYGKGGVEAKIQAILAAFLFHRKQRRTILNKSCLFQGLFAIHTKQKNKLETKGFWQ
jgi:hypothetical protein